LSVREFKTWDIMDFASFSSIRSEELDLKAVRGEKIDST